MPTINDTEYDVADCELKMDGVAYPFEDLKYSAPRESGEGNGNQRMPAWRTKGNCKFQAEVKVREHVWQAMQAQVHASAAEAGVVGGGVYDYNPTFTATKSLLGENPVTDTLVDCQIMDEQYGASAGVDAGMVTIPLKPWRIKFNGKTPFKEVGG
jgi:hypothetical protein